MDMTIPHEVNASIHFSKRLASRVWKVLLLVIVVAFLIVGSSESRGALIEQGKKCTGCREITVEFVGLFFFAAPDAADVNKKEYRSQCKVGVLSTREDHS